MGNIRETRVPSQDMDFPRPRKHMISRWLQGKRGLIEFAAREKKECQQQKQMEPSSHMEKHLTYNDACRRITTLKNFFAQSFTFQPSVRASLAIPIFAARYN
jgi:hypothetical protein